MQYNNPDKKLIWDDKSESHKDAMNSIRNLKIKDAFEKPDRLTNREKTKTNELYVEKLIRIVHFFNMQQFTWQRVLSKNDKVFIWWNQWVPMLPITPLILVIL